MNLYEISATELAKNVYARIDARESEISAPLEK